MRERERGLGHKLCFEEMSPVSVWPRVHACDGSSATLQDSESQARSSFSGSCKDAEVGTSFKCLRKQNSNLGVKMNVLTACPGYPYLQLEEPLPRRREPS